MSDKKITILAIETSCDETAAAVLLGTGKGDDAQLEIRSNVISSQIKLHAKFGGVVPSLASREHVKNINHVVGAALTEAGITDIGRDIDAVAVTRGPGLGPALIVGITYAKTLAWKFNKPLIGVNHMDGHVHSNWLEPEKPMKKLFPALNVVVSGGHTELVLMQDHGPTSPKASRGQSNYKIIGETLDDAIGEAFDKSARLLGLGYPGGPAIDKLAEKGNAEAFALPRPMLSSKNYDFSYSGLKTAVLYLIRDMKTKRLNEQTKADIAASFQKAAIDVIVAKAERAAKDFKVKALLLSGGVSASRMLRERLAHMTAELGIHYSCPKMKYTTDNAAMIAAAAYFQFIGSNKKPTWKSVRMEPNLSL
ncbi:MAG: tRNA (adenosine(37)-N6)-threonylcarbamoyltransferase complex transferase subunit TsaD [Patescibacteria group bacterium]